MEDVYAEGPGIQELNAEIRDFFLRIQEITAVLFVGLKQRLLQVAVLLCLTVLMFWVALFLYGSFYYSFMPTANLITPVHFYYRRTECPSAEHSLCSLPMANVSLLKNGKKQVMTHGQPYRITLELELPESPANEQLGMFLVKMSCYSHEGHLIDSSARSTMLHYRSSLLQALETLAFFPLLVMGVTEQKQRVLVELYSAYVANSYKPTIGAIIEIDAQQVQIYNAYLYIHAHFTGIRYILYHFPLASAVVGTTSNFAFLCILFLISYLKATLDGIWPYPLVANWNKVMLKSAGIKDQYVRTTQSEDHRTDTRTHVQDASVMGSSDIMNSSSGHMGEVILDSGMEEDMDKDGPVCFAGARSVSGAGDRNMYLKHRYLTSDSFLPSSDQDHTCYYSETYFSS